MQRECVGRLLNSALQQRMLHEMRSGYPDMWGKLDVCQMDSGGLEIFASAL